MSISLLTGGHAVAQHASAATTGAIDTTGANLLIIHQSLFQTSSVTPTDSKGNTWTGLTIHTNGGDRYNKIWYCINPTVGSGHTFSSTGNFPSIAVQAFSGASGGFDVQNGASPGGSTNNIQTGSLTPSADNAVLVYGAWCNAVSVSVDIGTLTDSGPFASPDFFSGIAAAYQIQTTATARNPKFSWTGNSLNAASIASFLPDAGGGAAVTIGWFAPPDRFQPTATRFTEQPPALALTPLTLPPKIGGMAWFEPPDRDRPAFKSWIESPPAIALTPATLPPKIAGMAWFEPPDRDKPPTVFKISVPPAIALTPATLPPKISGIAFSQLLDNLSPAKPSFMHGPPAFGRAIPTVPISGMAWFTPPDNRSTEAPFFMDGGPAFGRPAITPILMAWFAPPDDRPPSKRLLESLVAMVFPPIPTIGMGWFAPVNDRLVRRWLQDAPPALGLRPPQSVGMGWFVPAAPLSFKISVFDRPPAFGRLPQAPATPISGIGWFEPRDDDRRSAIFRIGTPPALALTPLTLPPKIGGMAWFEPPDRFEPTTTRWVEQPPGFAFMKFHLILGARITVLSGSLEMARSFGGDASSGINLKGDLPVSPVLDGDPQ